MGAGMHPHWPEWKSKIRTAENDTLTVTVVTLRVSIQQGKEVADWRRRCRFEAQFGNLQDIRAPFP